MPEAITINDQPISATFFGEGKWLTDFVTPGSLEVKELYKKITDGVDEAEDRLLACWAWVANQVKYTKFVRAKIWINGQVSVQDDYWQLPSQLISTPVKIGNCVNKALLLTSLIRNELPAEKVYCVLGNLNQGGSPGGHSWVEVALNSHRYIMESTRGDMKPLVVTEAADIYEPVIYFNDKMVSAIEERTLLQPFCAVYATWLKDYLDFAYINGGK